MSTKKTRVLCGNFLLVPIIFLIAVSCSKEKKDTATLSTLSTNEISDISSTTATSGGTITSDGGAPVTARGICWSTSPNPTLADSKATDGSLGTGSYACNIHGLTGNTTYYVKAYATNSAGTAYGDIKTFTSAEISLFATTLEATNVNSESATVNATINANFLTTEVYFEYGTGTDYGTIVTAIQSPVTGGENTNVNAEISGLSALTNYHFRVKIVNTSGTGFGIDRTFTTNYVIGDMAYGGIIFYCDGGGHGLVCATEEQGIGIPWYNGNNVITGATGTDVGSGQTNTTDIVAGQGTGNYAAQLCDDLVYNGYNDWFLPSKDELNLMYVNLKLQGLGNFYAGYPNAWYWSSSEIDETHAWGQWFGGGSTAGIQEQESKAAAYTVRAVRAY